MRSCQGQAGLWHGTVAPGPGPALPRAERSGRGAERHCRFSDMCLLSACQWQLLCWGHGGEQRRPSPHPRLRGWYRGKPSTNTGQLFSLGQTTRKAGARRPRTNRRDDLNLKRGATRTFHMALPERARSELRCDLTTRLKAEVGAPGHSGPSARGFAPVGPTRSSSWSTRLPADASSSPTALPTGLTEPAVQAPRGRSPRPSTAAPAAGLARPSLHVHVPSLGHLGSSGLCALSFPLIIFKQMLYVFSFLFL